MYKNGQIGKIITTFPVMLLIIVIIGIFIALSFGAAKSKEPAAVLAVSVTGVVIDGEKDLLLQRIEVTKDDKKESKLLVESILDRERGKISEDALRKILDEFAVLGGEGKCLFLAKREESILRKVLTSPTTDSDFDYGASVIKNFKGTEKEKLFALPILPLNVRHQLIRYYEKGLLGEAPIIVKDSKDKEKIIFLIYYYGKCLSIEEKK